VKAVVLAGGRGTRLLPYTRVIPKPLMPIGDMTILEVLLHQIKRAGVDEVIITVGYMASLLKAFFQDGEQLGLKITYSHENIPLGTAGPLSLIIPPITETFLVLNGDVLTTLDMNDLIETHRHSNAIATIASHERIEKIDYGVLEVDNKFVIKEYIEKPVKKYLVSLGIYIFEPKVLSYIPMNQYYDFPDLVCELIRHGEKTVSYPFQGYWQDLGRPDDYEQAILDFEKMRTIFLEGGPK
jgi:NDP-sugar pyrophosphorylase family protein